MNAAAQTEVGSPNALERLGMLEAEVKALATGLIDQGKRLDATVQLAESGAREDRLSLIVFSGSLDRLLAALILATGAAAMGMQVSLFFTFWATASLRKPNVKVKKTLLEHAFGWMLPRGSRQLPLSQMNLAGSGPLLMRHIMKKKGAASVEDMIEIAAELGVEFNICSMSMDLLGIKPEELLDYPNKHYCGVTKFLEHAAPGKLTLFL